MEKLSTLQILEALLSAGAMAGGSPAAAAWAGRRRPMPAAARRRPRCMSYLKYTQTQESSADQAAMTFLERTHQSVKGTIEFLRVLQREERMMVGRRDPYLSTHPLTPERIEAFEQAAARSPYTDTPESPQFLDMHHRIVAKLMGFISPSTALQRFSEADRSVPARYARAIALYRTGALGSALLTIDGLLKDSPNDPYFHEAARPDAVRERPRQRGDAVVPPRGAAAARRRHHQDRFRRARCSRPTSRRTTARRCATSSWRRRPNSATSTCGA